MEIKNICCCENILNCSQNVFRTICENCGIKTDEKMMDMLNGISAGFGINGVCSAVVGGLCALGSVFSEEEIIYSGFIEQIELEVFQLLISINGIGVKTALKILKHTNYKKLIYE